MERKLERTAVENQPMASFPSDVGALSNSSPVINNATIRWLNIQRIFFGRWTCDF